MDVNGQLDRILNKLDKQADAGNELKTHVTQIIEQVSTIASSQAACYGQNIKDHACFRKGITDLQQNGAYIKGKAFWKDIIFRSFIMITCATILGAFIKAGMAAMGG